MNRRPQFYSLCVIIVIVSFICNPYSPNIYLPDDFEKPISYKLRYVLFQTLNILFDLAEKVGIMDQMMIFKRFHQSISNLLIKTHMFKIFNEDLKITNLIIDNVPIEIFCKKNLTNVYHELPLMIYYHGGGYVLLYDAFFKNFLQLIASNLDIIVIGIDYRTAPEQPYPAAFDDCLRATDYIIINANLFNIDVSRIVFSGDSAGGGLAAAITQKYSKEKPGIPKIQALHYPWLQMFNFKLPSSLKYKSFFEVEMFRLCRFSLWHLGETSLSDDLVNLTKTNEHIWAIDDLSLIEKYKSFLSIDLIPVEYKNKSYYKDYELLKDGIYPSQPSEHSLLIKELRLKDKLARLFHLTTSPGLADDETLKRQPKTYFTIFEWDVLKDEGLIYAERLRKNGVSVTISFYENLFHGVLTAPDWQLIVKEKAFNDFLAFLKKYL